NFRPLAATAFDGLDRAERCSQTGMRTSDQIRHDNLCCGRSARARSSDAMPSSEPRYQALKGILTSEVSNSGLRNCSQNWRWPSQNSPSRYDTSDSGSMKIG